MSRGPWAIATAVALLAGCSFSREDRALDGAPPTEPPTAAGAVASPEAVDLRTVDLPSSVTGGW